MSMYGMRASIPVFFLALTAFGGVDCVLADAPRVTAVLSNAEAAENIVIDGLEINRTGTEQHFEMNNFNVSSSVIYNYTILPLKSGTFKIPPQTVRLGSSSLRTPELTLNVADSPGRSSSSRSNRNLQPDDANKLLFAELIVPKKVALVGEIVPVEIRLGFDPRAHPKLVEGPEISGQGFTAQKLQQSG